ncbi:MAG TPA: HD-GYP domain-containing protein [Vicinamibacterales bacterium]|nr:HD-GYP domain-containing protein [Vicinamibacterales bacterium]
MSAIPDFDPGPFLRGFVALRRLTGMYPAGHPVIAQKVDEIFQPVQQQLAAHGTVTIDIIHEQLHVNGVVCLSDGASSAQAVRELSELGAHSVEIRAGLQPDELRRAAEFLSTAADGSTDEPIADRLAAAGVSHVSFGRIVALDTRWRAPQWDDGPSQPLEPSYGEALTRAEQVFDTVASGRSLDAVNIRQLVQLLIGEVARSSAALAQILTLKEYENLTYCHSVNVAILSLMLGRQLRLDDDLITVLVEAALLHDIGKTRVPLEIVQKPGALDRTERKLIEGHTTFGAEILVDTVGVHPLAPTVALEHHRGINGTGYPDLGDGVVPHLMSQIVSVADIYEALTGARSYREPMKPEQACLVLAREAGSKLNTAFVKAFVSAVTFFPVGSLVRTNRDEVGMVVRTNSRDPLHPVITITNDTFEEVRQQVDTSERDGDGRYLRQIVQSIAGQPRSSALTALLSTGS